jgi:hypothetical protein
MNLGASAIVLRPRTLAEILDLACRLCISLAFGLYTRLSAAVLLPLFAGCLALRYALSFPWAAVWVIAILTGSFVQGVFTVAVGRLLFSEELGARKVFRLFLQRLGPYLGMTLLRGLLFGAAIAPAFLAVPFLWPRLVFVHEASLLEGAGPSEAIRRSSRFASGRGPSVFGALLALLFTQAGFVIVAELLGHGLVEQVLQLGKPFGSLLQSGGSPYALAGYFLSIPYVATARFLDYVDARTRSDGWDIQLRFMAIAARDEDRREAA